MPLKPATSSLRFCTHALIWLLCALVTTSCATGTVRPPAQIPGEVLALLLPLPSPDASLLLPCPEPAPAVDDSLPSLLASHGQEAELAARCRDKARSLADAERERAAIERERIDRAAKALKEK